MRCDVADAVDSGLGYALTPLCQSEMNVADFLLQPTCSLALAPASSSTAATDPAPPMPRRLPLAAALFGFPAAEGYTAPYEEAPDAWLIEFCERYADGDVLLGIFRSCKAGARADISFPSDAARPILP